MYLYYSSQFSEAKKLGTSLVHQFRNSGNIEKMILVKCFLSQIYQLQGSITQSIDSFESTLELYHQHKVESVFIESGSDFFPYCTAMLSLSYIHQGKLEKATQLAQSAVNHSSQSNYPISSVVSYIFLSLCYYYSQDHKKLIHTCETYYQRYPEKSNRPYHAIFLDLIYLTANHQIDEAYKILIKSYQSGIDFSMGWYTPMVADAMMENNPCDKILDLLNTGLEKAINNQEFAAIPIIKNSMAKYYSKRNFPKDKIKEIVLESVNTSKQQGAHLFLNSAIAIDV